MLVIYNKDNIDLSADTNALAIEEKDIHFAQGLNFYKIFWIFVIGSVVGFILETIWCFIRHGYVESRTSLMFSPITVVYGIGAIVLYIGLYKIDKKNNSHIFFFGVIAGTVIEYLASLAQEMVFGSLSWDYSSVPFNINGRVCLHMAVIWGVLAILWAKSFEPLFEKAIMKIPNSVGKQVTYLMFLFLITSALLSAIAVARWSDRLIGVPHTSALGAWLDSAFPNQFMETVYPNMEFYYGN